MDSAAVVGAGVMGRGIALLAARAGLEVSLVELVPAVLESAREEIAGRLERDVAKGRLTAEEATAIRDRISYASSIGELPPCDLAVEAVVERLDVKRSVVRELEDALPEGAVIASNTSSLSIAAVFAEARIPGRTAGLHFFNPVHAMRLVELVPHRRTDRGVIARLRELSERLGKTPIEVTDNPGFLVNHLGRAYPTEALAILEEGLADASQIDAIMREGYGFQMGPFELMDLTGIDINYAVTRNVFEGNFGDPRLRSTWRHRQLFEAGEFGRKSGRGFYLHDGTEGESEPWAAAAEPEAPVRISASPKLSEWAAGLAEAAGDVVVLDDEAPEIRLVGCAESRERALDMDAPLLLSVDEHLPAERLVVLGAPFDADPAKVQRLAGALARRVPTIVAGDGPGLVGARIVAALVNVACDLAQRGLASPDDVDTGARLGLAYPFPPLAEPPLAPDEIVEVLAALADATGDARYAPSPWLARRAAADLPLTFGGFDPSTVTRSAAPLRGDTP